MYKHKDLLGLQELTPDEIVFLLDTAIPMKEIMSRPIRKVPTLRGRTIVNLFYENSTRTRSSFELAGKYLSADLVNISSQASSVSKGEGLYDTALTLEALGAEVIILRHPMSGSPDLLARSVSAAVINAGDGAHEHPTQALLDLFTVRERLGYIEGLKVAIVGDILYSRVARSNIWGFTKLGAQVNVCGPPTLMPKELEMTGVQVFYQMEDAIRDVDVIIMLRIQIERQQELFPGLREYVRRYGLTQERLAMAKPSALVLHPGPVNRGIEIAYDIAEGPASVIEEQVTNGVAVRMALLYLLTGGGEYHDEAKG